MAKLLVLTNRNLLNFEPAAHAYLKLTSNNTNYYKVYDKYLQIDNQSALLK